MIRAEPITSQSRSPLEFESLRRHFPQVVQSQGEALHGQGRVKLLQVTTNVLFTEVQDDRLVRCSLDVSGGYLHCFCTCAEGRQRTPCAHLWAAALEGQGAGFLPPAWKRKLAALANPLPAPPVVRGLIRYVLDRERSVEADRMTVRVERTVIRKDGTPGRTELLSLRPDNVSRLEDPEDRRLHAALLGGRPRNPYDIDHEPGRFVLPRALAEDLVPRLCATGRFVEPHDPRPLSWDEQPWRLALRVEAGRALRVRGLLQRGEVSVALDDHAVLSGFMIADARIAPLDDGGLASWLRGLGYEGLQAPEEAADVVLAALVQAHPDRLELPAELAFERVRTAPTPRLRVESWRPNRLGARLSFDYGGLLVAADNPAPAVLAPGRKLVERDREGEAAALALALEKGFRRTSEREAPFLTLTPSKLPRAVRDLTASRWIVEAEGRLYRPPGAIRFRVSSGTDWFDLAGDVDFGGQTAALPAILAALRRGERAVRLGDGTFGILPEEWLAKYRFLADAAETGDGAALRFERHQASLLDALLAEQGDVDVDAAFEHARTALRRADAAPADPPRGFRGTLRPYQREGLGWLRFLAETGLGGCLADDMGLGKTVQVLAHLAGRPRGSRSLVVAPRSLVFNWKEEAARFTPRLRVVEHTGAMRARAADELPAGDVVLTTYGLLRRDIGWLKDVTFDYAVLDEAQAIKNAASDSAKAARLLRADHRLALSGTPVENHLGDLWSLFEFLNPGMLGRSRVLVAAGAGRTDVDEESRRVLSRALRPFLLRRTKRQVAKDLPGRVEQTLHCELGSAQRAVYDELRDHYRRTLLGRTARHGVKKSLFLVLEALLRLRQAACHPGLIDPARAQEPSAKLDALLPLLEEVLSEGSKALVFSQFTSFLGLLRPRLDAAGIAYEYLDGQTTDRQASVRRFQEDPECRVFLISLKAGGLGLNLTAAEYVFLLDPWWNPATEAQAIDRAHRIGQARTVFAYRLVARDTIEDKVLVLQEKKRALAEALIHEDESLLRELDQGELERLLT